MTAVELSPVPEDLKGPLQFVAGLVGGLAGGLAGAVS